MVHVLVNDILIIDKKKKKVVIRDKRKWTSELNAFLTNEV